MYFNNCTSEENSISRKVSICKALEPPAPIIEEECKVAAGMRLAKMFSSSSTTLSTEHFNNFLSNQGNNAGAQEHSFDMDPAFAYNEHQQYGQQSSDDIEF